MKEGGKGRVIGGRGSVFGGKSTFIGCKTFFAETLRLKINIEKVATRRIKTKAYPL